MWCGRRVVSPSPPAGSRADRAGLRPEDRDAVVDVEILVIGAGRDDDRVAVTGGVDRRLDRGVAARADEQHAAVADLERFEDHFDPIVCRSVCVARAVCVGWEDPFRAIGKDAGGGIEGWRLIWRVKRVVEARRIVAAGMIGGDVDCSRDYRHGSLEVDLLPAVCALTREPSLPSSFPPRIRKMRDMLAGILRVPCRSEYR